MTDQTAQPLSAEEEAKFRESVRMLSETEGEHEFLQWTNDAMARLLATLDEARRPPPGEGPMNETVETLTATQALGVALTVPASSMTMGECQAAAPVMLDHLRAMGYDVMPLARESAGAGLDELTTNLVTLIRIGFLVTVDGQRATAATLPKGGLVTGLLMSILQAPDTETAVARLTASRESTEAGHAQLLHAALQGDADAPVGGLAAVQQEQFKWWANERADAGAGGLATEADALAGALDATGDELGRWVKKAEIYRQGLAEAVVRASTAEMYRDRAWQNLDTAHEDIAAMLRASGLGDYARPISTHDVIRGELLPWIEGAAAHLAAAHHQEKER